MTANLKTAVEYVVPATQVQWGFPGEGDGSELLNYVPLAHFLGPVGIGWDWVPMAVVDLGGGYWGGGARGGGGSLPLPQT